MSRPVERWLMLCFSNFVLSWMAGMIILAQWTSNCVLHISGNIFRQMWDPTAWCGLQMTPILCTIVFNSIRSKLHLGWDVYFLDSFMFQGEKKSPWTFFIHLHLAPKNIALRMAVCLPCQERFIWFSVRENPHIAKFKLTSMPQRWLQISKLCFSPNTFKTLSRALERVIKGDGMENCVRRRCRKQKNKVKLNLMISTKISILSEDWLLSCIWIMFNLSDFFLVPLCYVHIYLTSLQTLITVHWYDMLILYWILTSGLK